MRVQRACNAREGGETAAGTADGAVDAAVLAGAVLAAGAVTGVVLVAANAAAADRIRLTVSDMASMRFFIFILPPF